MRKFLIVFAAVFSCTVFSDAQQKTYSSKTKALAEHFVECSRSGNYNKTYLALRKIQKHQWKLDENNLKTFYGDIHQAVADECDRQGIEAEGKEEMKIIIDAMFSDELKNAVRDTAASNEDR